MMAAGLIYAACHAAAATSAHVCCYDGFSRVYVVGDMLPRHASALRAGARCAICRGERSVREQQRIREGESAQQEQQQAWRKSRRRKARREQAVKTRAERQ